MKDKSVSETKVEGVRHSIEELAHAAGPNTKLPTVDEMCSLFHTSRATINDALQVLESRNVVRRQRGLGIFVSGKLLQRNIALVIGRSVLSVRATSPFWDALWGHMIDETEERTKRLNESVTVHVVREKFDADRPLDDHLATAIEAKQIDGILAVGMDTSTWQWIKEHDIPVIAFAGAGTWHVNLDTPELVRQCTQSLIDQGVRRLRLWMPGSVLDAGLDEVSGNLAPAYNEAQCISSFKSALESNGLPEVSGGIWWAPHGPISNDRYLLDQGAGLVARLVREGHAADTDGIVILDDMLTLGAYRAMLRHGISRYIKVASQANLGTSVLYAYEDDITQVLMDPAEIVAQMFEILDLVLADVVLEEPARVVRPTSVRLPRLSRDF
jgi:DNA-binding LacI/PurR family transcriptional regulator